MRTQKQLIKTIKALHARLRKIRSENSTLYQVLINIKMECREAWVAELADRTIRGRKQK